MAAAGAAASAAAAAAARKVHKVLRQALKVLRERCTTRHQPRIAAACCCCRCVIHIDVQPLGVHGRPRPAAEAGGPADLAIAA